MSVRMTKITGRYFPGDVARFTKAHEDELIKQGYAERVDEQYQEDHTAAATEMTDRRALAADNQPTPERKAMAGKR